MKKAIAYYRVSTQRQIKDRPDRDPKKIEGEITGLGLEAQQEAVEQFADREGYKVIGEYREVESGRKNDRPQLLAALARCRKEGATLIIARLDRLGRNVAFISNLMESKVEFKAVDNPHANRFMVHMLAAFAEHEREQISVRTKDALGAAKRRGVILGRHAKEVLAEKNATAAKVFAAQMRSTIEGLQAEGFVTIRAMRDELNRRQVPTYRGNRKWHFSSVYTLLKRISIN